MSLIMCYTIKYYLVGSIHFMSERRYAYDVKRLAEVGISTIDIAKYLNLSKEELSSEYSDILNTAAINKTVEVANHLYMMAMEGNVQSAIYWLKSIGKWDEISKVKEEMSKEDSFDTITVEILPKKLEE